MTGSPAAVASVRQVPGAAVHRAATAVGVAI